MSRGKQNKMANCLGQEGAAKQALQNLNMAHGLVLVTIKGSFFILHLDSWKPLSISPGFCIIKKPEWILCNKEARTLKLLTAGICSNPNLLEIAPGRVK